MKSLKQFFSIALISCATFSYAQVTMMPDQFRMQLGDGQQTIESVQFYELPYRTNTIDLRGIQPLTDYIIPQSIVITPPNLSSFEEVTVLIGLTGEELENPIVILWLAGDYKKRRITFFIDRDQDRDFTNDRGPIRLVAGDEPRLITMEINGSEESLWITPPEPQISREKKPKERIGSGFNLAFAAGIGTGEMEYSYDDLTIGYPSWYSVPITEKAISATATYTFKRFNFGVNIALQNHFYYTSQLNIKRGEPERRIIFDQFGRSTAATFDNIEIRQNYDKHSPNRVQYSAMLMYSIPIGKTFSLQPMARFGMTSYLNAEYNASINDDGEVYPLKSTTFYELGIRGEFAVGLQKAVFIELARNSHEWEPEGFLNGTDHENYTSSFVVGKYMVGYRFSLLGK